MKRILVSLFAFVLTLLLTALAVPFLIPAEHYKQSALALLKQKTGHEVKVEGALSFTLLPNIALQLENVTIANNSGFTSPYLAKINKLELELELWPLFSRQIKVDALSLMQPEIWLEENKLGQRNWELSAQKEAALKDADSTPAKKSDFSFNIEKLALKEGQLHLLLKGEHYVASHLNAEWLEGDINLKTLLDYRGAVIQAAAIIKKPQQWLEGKATALEITLEHANASFLFEGKAIADELHGKTILKVSSLKKIGEAFKLEADFPDYSLNLESMNSRITGKQISLNPMEFSMVNQPATGKLAIDWSGVRPKISGELMIKELSLIEFLNEKSETRAVSANVNENKGTWSTKPIDFDFLSKANLAMEIIIHRLRLPDLIFTNLSASLQNQAGVLHAKLKESSVLQGNFSGKLKLIATPLPQWQIETTFNDIAAKDALSLVIESPRLQGKTKGNLFLSSQGRTQQDWMRQLHGGGTLALDNGIIEGYALPQIFRNLKQTPDTDASTQQVAVNIQFKVDHGIANLTQGYLRGKELEANVDGNLNIGEQQVDLRLTPKLVPQFDKTNIESGTAVGLLFPVSITGPFNNISIRPDTTAALKDAFKNPEQAKQNIKALKREGEAVVKGLEDQKDAIKESWKELKENKKPENLGNLLNQLDQGGLPVPKILDGLKNSSGSTNGGAGTRTEPHTGTSTDSGGESAGQQGTITEQSGAPASQ